MTFNYLHYPAWIMLINLLISSPVWAACSPTGGDAGLSVSLSGTQILLGKLTTPDTGQSSVIIGTDDNRTIPANLSINSQNQSTFGDSHQAAIATINGSPDCNFRVEISNVDASRISNVTLLGTSGTSLSSSQSGAIGTLSATGDATIKIGATVLVNSNDSSIADNITLTVVFVP